MATRNTLMADMLSFRPSLSVESCTLRRAGPTPLALLLLLAGAALLAAPGERAGPVRIVTLGDSITKGVRPGVKPEETFSGLLSAELRKRGAAVEVVNLGIGGERTEQALARLE